MAFFVMPDNCQISIGFMYQQYFEFKRDGTFVEVGAYNGIDFSNTLPLVNVGWKGVCIEPNPLSFQMLKKNYEPVKENIQFYNIAIGKFDTCTITLDNSISTTSQEQLDIFRNAGWTKSPNSVVVSMRRLDDVLEESNIPIEFEVLCVDTEGTELDVLETFTLEKWLPKIAIIEASEHHPEPGFNRHAKDINKYFNRLGYEKRYSDHINNIYFRI